MSGTLVLDCEGLSKLVRRTPDGHKYAVGAIVAATAIASPSPVTVLTSDPEDLLMLCGPGIRVIKI
ncbi:hypothetical protein GCM10023086_20560 [Streptomyces venetus]|uniref:DNA-binding protein n=1 Tax=Streptomyces venetus TaxID=1701086 RepID=A0ABP8FH83_9ACTN